jgi:hypothetical protein
MLFNLTVVVSLILNTWMALFYGLKGLDSLRNRELIPPEQTSAAAAPAAEVMRPGRGRA